MVTAFLPRRKCLNFMAAVTVCSDFGAQENKVCHIFHCFPIYLLWNDGTGCHDLHFLNVEVFCCCLFIWMLIFKPAFPLSCFTFTKRLFSSSSLSAIRVVSSAYLRLLIFLLAILIQLVSHPAQNFTWCTLHISLNKVTIYILDILLSQFWNQLFHVWF